LIVTASNDAQAAAYEAQLRLRRELGLLAGVREVLVVPDPDGRRVGSGGSTLACLLTVLENEGANAAPLGPEAWQTILERLRILIVHGGGDSTRLPAYGPCGKVFVPVPGESDSAVGSTLFDRQLPIYLALPPMGRGGGQVVITAGDVLVTFDPARVAFASDGVTGLGCLATPEEASRHGVYCADGAGTVRRFLQKPTPAEQARMGAVDRCGRSVLDVGVFSLDAAAAVKLLAMCGVCLNEGGSLRWSGPVGEAIVDSGMDFYGEVCCAMGSEVTPEQHVTAARAYGSTWDEGVLRGVYDSLSAMPFHVQVLPRCGFLHFGTTRQIIMSGIDILRQDRGVAELDTCVSLNNDVTDGGRLVGANAWVEGCRVCSTLTLEGENVVLGVNIDEPVSLPRGACLDVVRGRDRAGDDTWFVRCYGVEDRFKDTVAQGATFCGQPIAKWLAAAGAKPEYVWESVALLGERRVWDARLFPAETAPAAYRRWLWMFDPSTASAQEREAWLTVDRYSLAEIAELADHEAFHDRRARLRSAEIRRTLRRRLRNDSGFSAADLSYVLACTGERAAWVAELLAEARWHFDNGEAAAGSAPFAFSRIIHTLASALERLVGKTDLPVSDVLAGLNETLGAAERAWLQTLGLGLDASVSVGEWVSRARAAAFGYLERKIIASRGHRQERPRNALRKDEIVWGRAPARLDVGGGWTDTPPYSLEHGGRVINAAVNLNGQPPIQAYARVIEEPVIRIASIDLGERIEIASLDELLDYRDPGSRYGLAKAALALSGLSPEAAAWPEETTLETILGQFGGGIELTTLAAIPKGSGLGASSIMGAVLIAVVQRMMGRTLTSQELFHHVLRLEQALTTGGGWQDQIGGVLDGVKVITTEPGLVPDPKVHYIPADVLDPRTNGGQTLLYYTGITRLAKKLLQQVVGRYLDRNLGAMATLRGLHGIVPHVAEAMASRDLPAFGKLVDRVWRLNKLLDPGSTNAEVEALLARVRPYVHGAKLLGAGGGGFLLMVCKSPKDAASLREMLEAEPPNERARFFDFDISREGLVVTVC
ncbi:hypothetical protein HQ576_16725, partial [bacterium]|nr:hypothetical protein [bacterium]